MSTAEKRVEASIARRVEAMRAEPGQLKPIKTLRDEFAMAALSITDHWATDRADDIAREAYAVADAMLAARGGDR